MEVGLSFDVALPTCAEDLLAEKPAHANGVPRWWLAAVGRLAPGWTLEKAQTHLAAISKGIFESTLPEDYDATRAKNYLSFQAHRPARLDRLLGSPRGLLRSALAAARHLRARAPDRVRQHREPDGRSRERPPARDRGAAGPRRLPAAPRSASSWPRASSSRRGRGAAGVAARAGALAAARVLPQHGAGPPLRRHAPRPAAARLHGRARRPHVRRLRAASRPPRLQNGSPGGAQVRRPRHRRERRPALRAAGARRLPGRALARAPRRRAALRAQPAQPPHARRGVPARPHPHRRRGLSCACTCPCERRTAFRHELVERIRAIPGVDRRGRRAHRPPQRTPPGTTTSASKAPRSRATSANFNRVGPGYFRTMGTPCSRAGTSTTATPPGAEAVAIVTEAFARKFLRRRKPDRPHRPDGEPGRATPSSVSRSSASSRDTKYAELREDFSPIVYLSDAQDAASGAFDERRRSLGAAALVASAVADLGHRRREPRNLGDVPAVPGHPPRRPPARAPHGRPLGVLRLPRGDPRHDRPVRRRVLHGRSAAGTRSACAWPWAQRGRTSSSSSCAKPGRCSRSASRSAIVLAVGAATLARSLLYGLGPSDPVTIALASVGLAAVAAAASLLPAHRAATLDPVTALREE